LKFKFCIQRKASSSEKQPLLQDTWLETLAVQLSFRSLMEIINAMEAHYGLNDLNIPRIVSWSNYDRLIRPVSYAI